MNSTTTTTTTITLDARRRTSLARIGRKEHTQYIVEEHSDGSLSLVPAVTISSAELAALSDPEVRAAMEAARNPDRSKTRSRGSFSQFT
jgi:hypothetical protein